MGSGEWRVASEGRRKRDFSLRRPTASRSEAGRKRRPAPLGPVRSSGMQTTQMTGGGARSGALRARGHDPFGYAQDKKRRGPKGPSLQGLFTESCAGERLPEEGEEAGAGAEAVVGIAGEVAAQHYFLVEEAEDDQGDNGEEARERPPGAKRERREEQHENGAEVHGMADEPIGSRGDDSLPFFDLDDARGETVFLHDPKGDQQADEYQDLGKNRQPKRDARPAETVIQAGDQ